MNLGYLSRWVVDFCQLIIGLRTGQTGRANTHLDSYLRRLEAQISHSNPQELQNVTLLISRMLAAKMANDAISLADMLEFELTIGPSQLTTNAYIAKQDGRDRPDRQGRSAWLASIAQTSDAGPSTPSAATVAAAHMILNNEYVDALETLAHAEKKAPLPPVGKYLLALLLAKSHSTEPAVSSMITAYEKDPFLCDGFIEIAAYLEPKAAALRLAARDIKASRLSPQGMIEMALLYWDADQHNAALAMIEKGYQASDVVRNGWARLACRIALAGDPEGAWRIAQRDMEQRRLSRLWKPRVAEIAASIQHFEAAAGPNGV